MSDDARQSASPEALKILAQVEAQAAGLAKPFDAPGLKALRTLVAGYPDMGAEGAGEVAASLFMLLEHLIASGRFDREALAVHVRAWRLMLTAEADGEAKAALLRGLKAVRDLYTDPKAA